MVDLTDSQDKVNEIMTLSMLQETEGLQLASAITVLWTLSGTLAAKILPLKDVSVNSQKLTSKAGPGKRAKFNVLSTVFKVSHLTLQQCPKVCQDANKTGRHTFSA